MKNTGQARRIKYRNAVLHYHVFGHGDKAMLAFHGYGQEGASLKILADVMPEYTFYAFDLFFHGSSRIAGREDERLLTLEMWSRIIESFLKEEGISHFEMLGFSMGGKFVFATLYAKPERVDKIVLIAPDGVKNVRWYSFATGNPIMRSVFRRVVVKPRAFFSVLRVSKMLGLAHPRMVRFAEREMEAVSKRKRVYNSWANFRILKIALPRIIDLINTHNISVRFYFGKYDRVITVKHLSSFINTVTDKEVHVLNAGHTNLVQAVAAFLSNNE